MTVASRPNTEVSTGLRAILWFGVTALIVLLLSRAGLAIWQFERVQAADNWSHLLLQGLRIDIATLCWLWGIAALGTVLFAGHHWLGRVWRIVLRGYLVAGLWLLVMLEVTTPSFIEEFGFRPNRLYVEYLIYPKEVIAMLWNGRPHEIILALLLGLITLWLGWRLAARLLPTDTDGSTYAAAYTQSRPAEPGWLLRLLLALLIIALTLIGARSTLGHRPLNPAMVAFSTDPLVNSLTVNSAYSLVFAIKQMGGEADAGRIYGHMDEADIIEVVRRESGRVKFTSSEQPTRAFNPASYQGKPKNLVIILQESLGARFVGSLGGLPLTPNIDRLSTQGWYFDQLYATGTRSVRGIEAIITGFTPTPARSVVKLGKSQSGFFTIADLLARQGYYTQFIYGGESHFDNMRSFFLGNGFQHIIEEQDYENPVFHGSWGVSDEDLMRRAHKEFEVLNQQEQPFFSLVFSSSNHDPFEFPDGRIELYEQPKQTRNNAAKYADYAVGEFFRLAQQADYWDDTVFLVVADHDSRVGGADLVPISRFRIPGLILGKDIAPWRDPRLVSQIDLAPTLLSLIGVAAEHPMIGRDLSSVPDSWPGRAMMQYDKNFAYMRGRDVVVLQPEKAPTGFVLNDAGRLEPSEQSRELKQTAQGVALWGSMAYQQGLYH